MAELNQTILESSNPKPKFRFDAEQFRLIQQQQERLESEGSSFSPFTIPSTVTDTINGGDANDTLNGGDSNDLIDGKNGNDLLDGKGGNDAIAGGRGDDTVIGGSGDDTVYGELASFLRNSSSPVTEGKNYLDGGDGDDILHGGSNHDTLLGGKGNDKLYGGSTIVDGYTHVYDPYAEQNFGSLSGNDVLNGGDGNDTLDGAAGADTLIGESGNDIMTGGYGHDLITGGDGNDTLTGGSDSDTLTGGEGADIFSFRLLFPIESFVKISIFGPAFTLPPIPERGIDTIEDFNALEGDKIKITGVSKADSPEVSLGQFDYNQNTGILSFENKEFAQLQAGTDFIVDRDLILSIN